MKTGHEYYVYILECADGSYYTGMSNNLERRFAEYEQGVNPSCYTYSRRPVILKHTERYQYVNDAIRREQQIKGWGRLKKEALINGDFGELIRLAKKRGSED